MPKQYESLYKRYKTQTADLIFADFKPRIDKEDDLTEDEKATLWEKPWRDLAEGLAKHEEWNFYREEFRRPKQNFPILMSYLNYTFLRVQELGLIAYSADGAKACFNTGLQTQQEQDIFVTFYQNKYSSERGVPDWTLFGFFEKYSYHLKPFEPLPDIATYITDWNSIVFDPNLEVDVNLKHILEKDIDRFPLALQANEKLALNTLEGAIKLLSARVQRNYRLPIPHWHEGKIQLLLPLYLTSDSIADLALVVEKDSQRNKNRATTVLTMDMAYNNARLIARPDREWLNP